MVFHSQLSLNSVVVSQIDLQVFFTLISCLLYSLLYYSLFISIIGHVSEAIFVSPSLLIPFSCWVITWLYAVQPVSLTMWQKVTLDHWLYQQMQFCPCCSAIRHFYWTEQLQRKAINYVIGENPLYGGNHCDIKQTCNLILRNQQWRGNWM